MVLLAQKGGNMKCPKCDRDDNSVKDTRKHDDTVKRIRECEFCGHIWKTWEVNDAQINVIERIIPT